MIKKKFYIERKDGVKLYHTYSDRNMMIQKDGTEEIYSEAIDVENAPYTYTETDIPIDVEPSPIDEDIGQKAEAFDYLTGRNDGDE